LKLAQEKILFLHGFWGQASDWQILQNTDLSDTYKSLPYTNIPELNSEHFLSDWGQNFLKFENSQISAVGYSQGGRLLLQAFAARPEAFGKLVLISAHPGLDNFSEKENRLKQDRQWAEKFRNLEWEELQKQWDLQGVFHEKKGPLRLESDFDREALALCFENWSLAHQQNFRELIIEYPEKIKIILGEQDVKYVSLYQDFLKDKQQLKLQKGAAHRIPFDQPEGLVKLLTQIFNE
jgi:2-succinyl-6-hydroxy-2,4-cyclohexadiene-1-carboxylate synthase